MEVEVKLTGSNGTVRWVGAPHPVIPADSLIDTQFFITREATEIREQQSRLTLQVWSNGKQITTENTSFIGPLSSE